MAGVGSQPLHELDVKPFNCCNSFVSQLSVQHVPWFLFCLSFKGSSDRSGLRGMYVLVCHAQLLNLLSLSELLLSWFESFVLTVLCACVSLFFISL